MGVGQRLYYTDSFLADFTASVTGSADGGRRLYLDRTAFYPESGGQPHDLGSINGTAVLNVLEEEGGRIAHVLAGPLQASEVRCSIDWPHRFDHMQQHTGQHLLSAVVMEMFGARTVGFHMSADYSTVDLSGALDPAQSAAAEERANAIAFENRPVTVSFEESSADLGLRKPSEREGVLRIITIENLDRSACGGTHVRATGEIGPVLIRKIERAHGATRVEFLCGMRAVRRARADYDALSRIARALSAPLDETPALVAARNEALSAAEKTAHKLAVELARVRGGELYAAAAPRANGPRRHEHRIGKGALDDEVRALAQGFTAGPDAVFIGISEEPPSVMLAVSANAGIHAGNLLKSAVTAHGGRGGGSAQMAQGSVPDREALASVLAALP